MNENKTPLISVIMSVYNEHEFIRDSVKSILDQTLGDFEFIIIDDRSTDDTVKIIEEFNDDRVILVKNEENSGLTVNLNRAIKMSKGKYIARMDGDDISFKNRFEVQTKFLEDHPETMLISCNTTTFGDKILVSDIEGTPEEHKCTMLIRPVLAHPGFMFRRELVEKYGYTYDEHFIAAQDYDIAARVSSELAVDVTPEVLIRYRAHKNQVSQTVTGKQLSFADEIRTRLLGDLGIKLDEKDFGIYRKWALETDAGKEEFIRAQRILKYILHMNIEHSCIYDPVILKKTLTKLYHKWILRTNGKKHIASIFGPDIAGYMGLVSTAFRMRASKARRQAMIESEFAEN
ncbi:MAG: glycosyltransferase family 2 protein [Lachnospiraceae bacterium]|nr:glycosyltransferase family 2 protein [Lachnospiraceae bacterium]